MKIPACLTCLLLVFSLVACRSQSPGPAPTNETAPTTPAPPTPTPKLTPSLAPASTLIPTPIASIALPKIDRRPRPATLEDWAPWAGRVLTSTLHYNPASADGWQVDYRTQDLSQLDLHNSQYDLSFASFDELTTWPASNKLPFGFDPQRILELGQNPGLGLRALHQQGITGEGVGIAIIDVPLLVDHQEITDALRLYEELYFSTEASQPPAQMHSTAVASLAAGKTVGVAPGADLYFIAVDLATGQDANGDYRYDFSLAAQAVRRILEVNQQLPAERKIRVISMSFGWLDTHAGAAELNAAVNDARAEGLFVLSAYPTLENTYGFKLGGLERSPLLDPGLFVSYSRSHFCDLYALTSSQCQAGRLLAPTSSRSLASPLGVEAYAFYRMGGDGWAVPYLAGIYALAAQVDPEITPERFWELALQTGRSVDVVGSSGVYTVAPVIDPAALLRSFEE